MADGLEGDKEGDERGLYLPPPQHPLTDETAVLKWWEGHELSPSGWWHGQTKN